eukprot:jgi/Botrbrau1/20977/Bobra.0690s0002.1
MQCKNVVPQSGATISLRPIEGHLHASLWRARAPQQGRRVTCELQHHVGPFVASVRAAPVQFASTRIRYRHMSRGATSLTLHLCMQSPRQHYVFASAQVRVRVPSIGFAPNRKPSARGSAGASCDIPSIGFESARKPCRQRTSVLHCTEVHGLVSTARDSSAEDEKVPLEPAKEEVSELAKDLRRVASDARWPHAPSIVDKPYMYGPKTPRVQDLRC